MITVITGGAGFIGSAVARFLAARRGPADTIVLADDLSRRPQRTFIDDLVNSGSVEMLRCDLRSPASFVNLPNCVDRVYHLAGIVGVGRVNARPFETLEHNIRITLNTLDWFCRAASPNARLVFASSSEVVSSGVTVPSGLPVPTPEAEPAVLTSPYSPRQSYRVSKLVGEMLLAYCRPPAAASMLSVRYHNVYGPDMGTEHAIPQIIERIKQRQSPFEIYGADQTRSFCWIDDAVSSTCALMEACGVESGMVVNIGNPHGEIAMCEVYERLFDLCGWRPEHVVYREADRDSAKRRCPDTQRLESLIAGIRYLPLDEGLKRTAEWYLGFAS